MKKILLFAIFSLGILANLNAQNSFITLIS